MFATVSALEASGKSSEKAVSFSDPYHLPVEVFGFGFFFHGDGRWKDGRSSATRVTINLLKPQVNLATRTQYFPLVTLKRRVMLHFL